MTDDSRNPGRISGNRSGKADDSRDVSIKIYHELMANKVADILLVSSPYDAFIMEEEGRLSHRIINEYKGLNLSRPPKLTWVSSAEGAFDRLEKKHFDLILAMPSLDGMDVYEFGEQVKKRHWIFNQKTPRDNEYKLLN